ncbi:hypothetical protein KQI65_11200 [bacterium]|nr:hypothetical protein [bacterium]
MTTQLPEVLFLDGEKREMTSVPVLPEQHARIVEEPLWQPEDGEEAVIASSACWRQYRGTWEIRDGRLYLRRLQGRYRLSGQEEIWATWVTASLQLPAPDADQDTRITVKQGVVTAIGVIPSTLRKHREDVHIWENLNDFDEMDD